VIDYAPKLYITKIIQITDTAKLKP